MLVRAGGDSTQRCSKISYLSDAQVSLNLYGNQENLWEPIRIDIETCLTRSRRTVYRY